MHFFLNAMIKSYLYSIFSDSKVNMSVDRGICQHDIDEDGDPVESTEDEKKKNFVSINKEF